MAITVTTPNTLALLLDDLNYKLSTTNLLSSSGVNAQLVLKITASGSLGQTFTINALGNNQEFEIVSSDLDNGLSVLVPNQPTTSLQADKLIEAFEKNYYIYNNFTIVKAAAVGGHTVTLTAQTPGTNFTLSTSNLPAWLTEDSNTAGVDDTPRDNYELLIQLFIEEVLGSGNFNFVDEIGIPPTPLGESTFYIREFLEPYFAIDFPDLAATDALQATESVKQIYINYAEAFGVPKKAQRVFKGDGTPIIVLPGGTTKEYRASNNFFTDHINQRKFLTNQPSKTVGANDPEFLHFCSIVAGDHEVHFRAHFPDGTNTGWVDELNYTAQQHEVFVIPVNPTVLNIPSPAYKYDVKVIDDSGESEIKTYYIDQHYQANTKHFMYTNAFGFMETLRCVGNHSKSIAISNNTALVQLPENHSSKDSQFKSFNHQVAKSIVVNTGFNTKEQQEHCVEFAKSKNRFIVENGEYQAIHLANAPAVSYDATKQNAYSYQFTYSPAVINE